MFQDILLERIIGFAITQIWPFFYCPYFTYKLLKRAKNRSTITLSCFFISYNVVFILAFFSIIFKDVPNSRLFYVFSFYLYIFNKSLLILTIWMMTKLAEKIPNIKMFLILTIYAIFASYVFWLTFYFNGITYSLETGWRPKYNVLFFWVTSIYTILLLIVPGIILARNLFNQFKGLPLWKRIKEFLTGILLDFIEVFFISIYNTWYENTIYRSLNLFIALPLTISAAILIYDGFGRSLK